jgi:hypothetical protein
MRLLTLAERATAKDCFDIEIKPGSRPGLWRWRFKVLDSRIDPTLPPADVKEARKKWRNPGTQLTPEGIRDELIEFHGDFGPPDFNVYFVEAPPQVIAAIFSPRFGGLHLVPKGDFAEECATTSPAIANQRSLKFL